MEDLSKIILTTQDGNANGAGTQRTASNHGFNNTGRNWRKLITPSHDSLDKFKHLKQPEYSGNAYGSRTTTQQPAGATTNSHNTSMDTSNLSMSVKHFTPSQEVPQQLKMTQRH